jgi:hypothetical protein
MTTLSLGLLPVFLHTSANPCETGRSNGTIIGVRCQMSDKKKQPLEPRGGVNISGDNFKIEGDVVGRDKVTYPQVSRVQLDEAFQPLDVAVGQHADAVQKLEQLKEEADKGKKADDSVMASLIKGIVDLVPSAVSAVMKAFGAPLLSEIVGPVTKFVLNEIQGK